LKTDLGEDNFIFVGSSCDMFAGEIPTEWMLATLKKCALTSGNKYLFQSKNPAAFAALRKVAFWKPTICTTIETNRWYSEVMRASPRPEDRASAMGHFSEYPRYVTIEPVLAFDLGPLVELVKRCEPVQVNIGADSGRNNLPEPSRAEVLALIDELAKFTRVEKKANLKRILG
jgi:DNA repair photolyase